MADNTNSNDIRAELLAGIDAGIIRKLPGMARRNVALNEFDRDGLAQLSRKSWIRSEPRLMTGHNGYQMRAYDDPAIACTGCGRTLGEMFNYTTASAKHVPQYEVIRFVPRGELDNDKHGTYFCFDCGASRETMLNTMADANVLKRYRDCIASDGLDVFAFVAQSIVEDRLHGSPEWHDVELRLLHGGKYGGGNDAAGQFYTTIGGRMLYHRFIMEPRDKRNAEYAAKRELRAIERANKASATDATPTATDDATDDPSALVETPTQAPPKPRRRRPALHERDIKK
jgi:predicted Fe-S protein YdhL (DUF1289 family)